MSAETAHIPVLLTVGKLEPFKPEEARRVKADAHIVKPFEASELLTAITRLEDRMVPQSEARFSTSVADVAARNGRKRKARCRYRMEEPPAFSVEEEERRTGTRTRRFRGRGDLPGFPEGEGQDGARAQRSTVKAPPPPGQEPALVPDIPRDITPEELDALSALAAKLDGPISAENIAPLAEKRTVRLRGRGSGAQRLRDKD